jgi:hypothetical protein
MPGFPLAAIGAGLGQFAQQYRQQQEAAQRAQLQRLYMDQQRKQQMARELEGLALSSGGIPGFGPGTGNISPVGGGGLPGSGAMPQPAPPPAAPAAATPASLWQEPGQADKAGAPTVQTDTGGGATADTPGNFNPDEPSQTEISQDPGAQPDRTGWSSPPGDYGSDAANAAVGGGASAPATPAAQAPIEPVAETKDGKLIFNIPGMGHMDLSSLFRQVDPQAIAAKIKELRPDAPPDAIAMATENLYKMANSGSKSQQLETMALLRYMQATRQQNLTHQDRVASQGIRVSEGAANRAAAGERQDKGIAASAERQQTGITASAARQKTALDERAKAAAARGDPAIKMQLGTLEKQMGDIRARMNLIINGPNPNSSTSKQAIDAYNKQLDALEKRRDAIADKVLGTAQ